MNRFKDAKTLEEVVFQAVGAGSVCWENMSGTGVFQSDEARKIGDEATERIREMIYARGSGTRIDPPGYPD